LDLEVKEVETRGRPGCQNSSSTNPRCTCIPGTITADPSLVRRASITPGGARFSPRRAVLEVSPPAGGGEDRGPRPAGRGGRERVPPLREVRWEGSALRPRSPHDGVYARIARSRIHGVGVRAIRDIPAGTTVFRGEDERVVWVSRAEVRRLPKPLRQLYEDFAMAWGDRYGVPRTMNMLSVGWYLNHSDRPNVEADETGRCHSLRRIRRGEERTADYRTFTDERLAFRPKPSRRFRGGRRSRRRNGA